ncbi:type II secretion system protein [Criibacterium bergeronii]|mgnify:CR=1 FL=1|uniref:Type II secretion system protein n=1 Tax=Criibacterium bergeronii TaxID=1871336 RepID=A0A371IK27_9FIRM|nr:type II secretion system protein [Criibacterium bergeronii]MBS6062978.1 type II secretion system protein [Peptostreptococcaceae bacterium]RDY20826.1 type II secretion system protein [Criibacterium bergeronii]
MYSKRRGFTLLEIIAAITLMLVIVSAAMPVYSNIVEGQKLKTDKVTAMQISQIAKTYIIENKNTATQDEITDYVKQAYDGELPKPESSPNSEFSIVYNSENASVDVKIGDKILVDDGKLVSK